MYIVANGFTRYVPAFGVLLKVMPVLLILVMLKT